MGGLIKRLDTGEGSYAKELEEDYDVAEQLDQVKEGTTCVWTHSICARHTWFCVLAAVDRGMV